MFDSIKNNPRLIGLLYLSMSPFAYFSAMYIPVQLIVPSDPSLTIQNISAAKVLFRTGILSWIICQTIFVFLVLSLFHLFKNMDKNMAISMVVLALLGVPIALLNELNYVALLELIPEQNIPLVTSERQVALFLNLHTAGMYIAQVFWGLWLFPFGLLVYRCGFLPKFLGVLLLIGGVSYLVNSILFFSYPTLQLSSLLGIGEFIFPMWLLIMGCKQQTNR